MGRASVHPGEYIAETLDELNMSARVLAQKLGIPAHRITEIIRGVAELAPTPRSSSADGSAPALTFG